MISPPRKTAWPICLLLLLFASPAWAQKKKLALEDLTSEPPLSERGAGDLAWLPGGDRFFFTLRKGLGEETVSQIVVEDAKTGTKKTVVAAESLTLPEGPRPAEVAPGVEKELLKSAESAPRGERQGRRPRRASATRRRGGIT